MSIETRKPPGGLAGAPHLVANNISVDGLNAPLKVFEGSAREGARGFPANVNVAAALSLAGIGPDRTTLETPISGVIQRIGRDAEGAPVPDGQLVTQGFAVAQVAPSCSPDEQHQKSRSAPKTKEQGQPGQMA